VWVLSIGYFWNSSRTTKMIASADLPTESIVSAAKMKGRVAPMSTPERTSGESIETVWRPADSMKAAMRPTEVRTAEPMAKPLPVAAVVLPIASSASVLSRTCSVSSSIISAMPPALSATGP
jgi:hypothetical protein